MERCFFLKAADNAFSGPGVIGSGAGVRLWERRLQELLLGKIDRQFPPEWNLPEERPGISLDHLRLP